MIRICCCIYLVSFRNIFHQSQQKCQAIAEATEIIGVIKLGLGLVQYMGKVFRELCPDTDCGLAFNPTSEVDRELLQQSKLISQ